MQRILESQEETGKPLQGLTKHTWVKNFFNQFLHNPRKKKFFFLHQNRGPLKKKPLRMLKICIDLLLGFLKEPSKFGFHSMLLSPSKAAKIYFNGKKNMLEKWVGMVKGMC